MSRIIECKYECGTRLGEFDQDAHKYKEIDTGEIHTYERCQAAKAKKTRAGILLEQKDDHGNESFTSPPPPVPPSEEPKDYVDHTLAKPSKVKIIFGEFAPDVEKEYEEFQVLPRYYFCICLNSLCGPLHYRHNFKTNFLPASH